MQCNFVLGVILDISKDAEFYEVDESDVRNLFESQVKPLSIGKVTN